MTKKNDLSPEEQFEAIKKTFANFYERLQAEDWLGAYIVAFGMFENRIRSMYGHEREFRHQQGLEEFADSGKHRPIGKQINYLERHERLQPDEAESFRKCCEKRNMIVHDLVWARKEADYPLCMHTLDLERKAKNARKRQAYWHDKINKSK